jgi:hypothetical protein
MPYPIQPVTAFSEAELWYIYQQLIEINTNTSGGGGGLSQTELYEVFNGTNPQGLAVALFESLSGGDTPLANLLVETISGNNFSIANETYNIRQYLSSVRTPIVISTSASATISGQLHNISIYNSGAAVGTITVNGTTINLPVGVTVNYDAGGNNNRFASNVFGYNATGTTFIISYVS